MGSGIHATEPIYYSNQNRPEVPTQAQPQNYNQKQPQFKPEMRTTRHNAWDTQANDKHKQGTDLMHNKQTNKQTSKQANKQMTC
jgi:hypothetical protein